MYHIYWNHILLETIFLKKIEHLHCITFITRIIVKNDRVVFSLSPSLLGINWRSLRSSAPAFALASPGFLPARAFWKCWVAAVLSHCFRIWSADFISCLFGFRPPGSLPAGDFFWEPKEQRNIRFQANVIVTWKSGGFNKLCEARGGGTLVYKFALINYKALQRSSYMY